ncbi:MAG: hypothetical protein WA130_11090 [Candidatus Methanoperedens sp.]
MMRKTIKEKDDNTNYVIGLIDGENALSPKINDYPERSPYGIPANARGLEYFINAKKDNLVLGYKTKSYRDRKKGPKWKVLPKVSCKNHGIFAVFKVESGFGDIRSNKNWLKDYPNWDSDYPNTIFLSKPLFVLKEPILFKELRELIPDSEYVNDYRRSVTRFLKKDAKKIFELMREKNPDKDKEINILINMMSQ